jgi:hypothetical protein
LSNRTTVIVFVVLFVIAFGTVGQAVYHPGTYPPTIGDFIEPALLAAVVALMGTGLAVARRS